jgi:hypoxanthine phosphoribosyltransferase
VTVPHVTFADAEQVRAGTRLTLPGAGEVEVLLSADAIATRVRELGAQVAREYAGRNPLFVSILKGGIVFLSDLIRSVSTPHEIDFLAVTSYGARTTSSGRVRLLHDLSAEVRGRDVLLVEDIVDTGRTLRYLLDYLELRGPATLRVCALLLKPTADPPAVEPDIVGFHIPNRFVIGYGMDLAGQHRNLPFIAALSGNSDLGPLGDSRTSE